MSPGSPTGCAPGSVLDMIRSMTAVFIGGSLRVKIDIWEYYRERYFAIFVNGIWTGKNQYAPINGIIDCVVPITPGSTSVSIWIEEVGQWDSFESGSIPSGPAEAQDALTARRILMQWRPSYTLSGVTGDSQLSSIVITGAKRGRNVENSAEFPQRGRLSYTITSDGTTRIVRWWAGNLLVAEGSRSGNGSVTCTERNGSGLTATATLTYSGDLTVGEAYLDVRWPKSYQIHYSTSALSYPRAPEDEVDDDSGGESFQYLTDVLAAGTYNYNIVCVDDDDDEEASPTAPSDSPVVIRAAPAAPTITSITGTATGGMTVNWTVGESGCTYTVYYSPVNEPINRGTRSTPAPITTALNATSESIPAISGYAPVDRSTAYATLLSDMDAAVTAGNALFDAAGSTVFDSMETDVLDAIETFGTSVGMDFRGFKEAVARQFDLLQGAIDGTVAGFSTAEWKNTVGPYYSNLLLFLGALVEGKSGRYALPDGFLPGGSPPGTGTATGTALDGSSGRTGISFKESLLAAVTPLIKNGRMRVIVRATKSSIEEKGDAEYVVEFDASGNIVGARPNQAQIQEITVDGLQVTVRAGVVSDDASGTATIIDLYVYTGSISLGSPSSSANLPTAVGGYHEVSQSYTVPMGATTYNIAVLARTAGGVRSEKYQVLTRYFNTDTPNAASSKQAKVVRGMPARFSEEGI